MSKASREPIYQNPVYAAACADPFVLKYLNEYWCYCTGWWHDGRCFGVLHSRDLQHWREVGGAMIPFDPTATCYWAPEVTYENGRFLLYYSVGNEEFMQIRAAEATHPAGPFNDCGVRLTKEDFAIDPHVFVAQDGARYLFYATDFLAHTHIGTGTVCDRMINPLQLAGTPQPVTRARYDWQVYDPQRASKGGVRWHTVEGPFVLEHKGRYYQMFSGGNWQNATYGASYAVSEVVLPTEEWEQVADGQQVFPVLRTIPQHVMGPGHNSAIRGPDNQQIFCVYHGWYPQADISNERLMAIDRLDWVGERLTVLGPTVTPQPAPSSATLVDFFEQDCDKGLGDNWRCSGGNWKCQDGVAVQSDAEALTEAECVFKASHFTTEVSLRLEQIASGGAAGVKLHNQDGGEIAFHLLSDAVQVTEICTSGEVSSTLSTLPLPADFVPTAFHLLRVELNGFWIKFALDNNVLQWTGKTQLQLNGISLFTHKTTASFAGVALTGGWQDLFDQPQVTPTDLGWHAADNKHWHIRDRSLWYDGQMPPHATVFKECLAEDYELVINVRLLSSNQPSDCYGFLPALDETGAGPLLTVEPAETGWYLRCMENGMRNEFALAPNFDPFQFQQFRLRKQGLRLTLQHEASELGSITVPPQSKHVGLYAHGAAVAFDLVRISISKIIG
ncbi:MAG TPA: glycoside hydrolase family 43 protein [Blastocatellia bacterium]|nr:glycoside hydrolase family 43 protein [Blastocatellia bacterium]